MKQIYDKQLSVMLTTEQVNEIKRKSQANHISLSEYIRKSILANLESEPDNICDISFPKSVNDDRELNSLSGETEPYPEHSDDLARSNDEELCANEEYLNGNIIPIDSDTK